MQDETSEQWLGDVDRRARAMTPGVWAVAAFTALYVAVATPAAWMSGNGEFIFYILVMLLLGGLIAAVHVRVKFATALLACLSAWGLMHMAGGLAPVPERWPIDGEQRVLYSWWLIDGRLKYDQIVHAFGFGVTTWACWQALSHSHRSIRPTAGVLLLCAVGGMGFGALNEVVEFVATLTMPETNVGGYENTGWDLVFNAAGATLAAVTIRVAAAIRRTDDSP